MPQIKLLLPYTASWLLPGVTSSESTAKKADVFICSLFSVLDLRETAFVNGSDSARGRLLLEQASPRHLLSCSVWPVKGKGFLSPEACL